MAKNTYNELLEKIKSRQVPTFKPEELGLSDAHIKAISNLPPEGFISELVKILEDVYKTNDAFRAMLDSDNKKGTEDTHRKLTKLLNEIPSKINNSDTKNYLLTHPSELSERVLKSLNKKIKKRAPIEVSKKDTGPLSPEELKLFGFEEGKIPPNTDKERYYEAIKDFIDTATKRKMLDADRDSYIERFKKTYNIAVGASDVEVLDASEIKNFKLKGEPLKSVNEISSDIKQDEAFEIVQSLHKKRLAPEVKKDLIIKFFNTIRDKKIKAHKTLNKFEEQWLKKEKISIMAEAVVRPKTRIEYLKGQEPMTQEERREFRRDDRLKMRTKIEDTGRVFEITKGALLQVSRLFDNLERTNWEKELEKLTNSLKDIVPPVGEFQEYVEEIEQTLEGMDVNQRDLPYILHVQDGQYKPRLDNTVLETILQKQKSITKALSENPNEDEKNDLTESLKDTRLEGMRLLKLRKLNLKGVKNSVENYLNYIKSKEDTLSDFKKTSKYVRESINKIEENIKEIRNHFKDLMREEEFAIRWNRPSSVSEEDKKVTEESGKDFPKERSASKAALEKNAMDADKYQKLYSKFMDDADSLDDIKDRLGDIIKVIALKMLSVVEMAPSKMEEIESLKAKLKGTSGESRRSLLSDIEQIKMLSEKLGIKKDFRNNPYGGKGPSLKKMEDILDDLVKDLGKIDVSKQTEKIYELLHNMENLSLWVKLPKVKEASVMLHMASYLRGVSECMLKEAAERREAPSNVGTFYDITFGRKRPTSSGITRRLPNFFVQDTAGLAKKFVEYLEKEGIPDMIKNPEIDVSKQIEEALKKTLKIPGKIEDYLANVARRRFMTDKDISKARENLKRIETEMQGVKGEKDGLPAQLANLKAKHIPQIEKAINFIIDPLEDLWKSVIKEEGDIPKAEKSEKEKTHGLKELIQWANSTKSLDDHSILDIIYNPSIKKNQEKAVVDDLNKFIEDHKDIIIKIKKGDKIDDVIKDKFLKEYNEKFITNHKDIPPLKDIKDRKDVIIKRGMQDDFKKYINKKIEDLQRIEKEFIDKFNKITGLNISKLPSREEIEKQWEAIEGTALDISDLVKSKELALKALQTMPKDVEKDIKKMPTDVMDTRWYKNIQKDRSRHKTKWLDSILKSINEPVKSEEQYSKGISRIKNQITNLSKEKDTNVSKATEIPPDRIKKQFDEQLLKIQELMEKKNPQAEIIPLDSFRVTVINPLNNMVKAKNELNTMKDVKEAFIDAYQKLNNYYQEEIVAKPKEEEEFRKERQQELSKIRALISYYEKEVNKSDEIISRTAQKIYPYAADFVKAASDLIRKGFTSINREYLKIIDNKLSDLRILIKEVKYLEDQYRQSLERDKETVSKISKGFKKEAAGYDPYGEQASPYEVALEKTPGKSDLIIKDKPEFYKKIEKTINYFKKMVDGYRKKETEDTPGEVIDYFENISLSIPNLEAALKAEIIPGLKALLKQKVEIPGAHKAITSLEDAVGTLDSLMMGYTEERTRIKNRIDDELRKHGESLNKIKELNEFIDPKTDEFIDFSDKEKDILKRVFLRQVYKYLDALWSQSQAKMMTTLGERDKEHYNNVWRAFKDYSGIKSNRKLISLLQTYRADVKADSSDEVKSIYLKSQQLEDRKRELEKGIKDLGLDPSRNEDIKELDKSIAAMREKEKVLDVIFNEMLKGSELTYISKIRENLREKAKLSEADKEIEEFVPTAPVIKKRKPEEDKEDVKETVGDVNRIINKIDDKLKPVMVPVQSSIDSIIEKANASIKSIEEELKKGAWEIKSAAYKKNALFNNKILHGPVMRSTIKNLIKWELGI